MTFQVLKPATHPFPSSSDSTFRTRTGSASGTLPGKLRPMRSTCGDVRSAVCTTSKLISSGTSSCVLTSRRRSTHPRRRCTYVLVPPAASVCERFITIKLVQRLERDERTSVHGVRSCAIDWHSIWMEQLSRCRRRSHPCVVHWCRSERYTGYRTGKRGAGGSASLDAGRRPTRSQQTKSPVVPALQLLAPGMCRSCWSLACGRYASVARYWLLIILAKCRNISRMNRRSRNGHRNAGK